MADDFVDIEITPEGVIKSTTPKISAANHSSANAFFATLVRLCGGETTTTRRTKSTHTHAHEHEGLKGGN